MSVIVLLSFELAVAAAVRTVHFLAVRARCEPAVIAVLAACDVVAPRAPHATLGVLADPGVAAVATVAAFRSRVDAPAFHAVLAPASRLSAERAVLSAANLPIAELAGGEALGTAPFQALVALAHAVAAASLATGFARYDTGAFAEMTRLCALVASNAVIHSVSVPSDRREQAQPLVALAALFAGFGCRKAIERDALAHELTAHGRCVQRIDLHDSANAARDSQRNDLCATSNQRVTRACP